MIKHMEHELNIYNDFLLKCDKCNVLVVLLNGKFKYWKGLKEMQLGDGELTCNEGQIKIILE